MTTTENQPATPPNPAAGFTPQTEKVDFSSRMAEFIETGNVRATAPPDESADTLDQPSEASKEQPKSTEDTLGLSEKGIQKPSKEKPATVPDETDKKVQKAQLREAYETTKKSFETASAEREAARKEAAELKQALEARDKELKSTREEALAAKKRIADVSYLESDEYKEKWVSPRNDAVNRAVKEIADYTFTDENGETRKGTEEDFISIVQATPAKALSMSKRFGDAASDVMSMRRGVVEMIDREHAHIKQQSQNYEATRSQREAEAVASQKQAETAFATRFDERTKALTDTEVEGFTAAPEWIATGKDLVTAAFKNTLNLDATGLAKVQSEVAARAASWLPTVRLAEHLMKQLDETRAKLEKYEKSTPNTGGTKSASSKPSDNETDSMSARMEKFLANH